MATNGVRTFPSSDEGLSGEGATRLTGNKNTKWGSDPLGYWSRMLMKQAESHLTIKAFCKEEGFSTCSFYSWRKRLGSNFRKPKGALSERKNFVELFADCSESGIQVAIGNQVHISVARGFDPETFRSALSVVCDILQ